MLLFTIAIIIFVSLLALALVIRDLGRELTGLDEASKGAKEREDAKTRKEIEKWRNGR